MVLKNNKPVFYSSTGLINSAAVTAAASAPVDKDSTQDGQETMTLLRAGLPIAVAPVKT